MLDIRAAAGLTGHHPETLRRWAWTGRLAARRRGNRLYVAGAGVEALAGGRGARRAAGLREWAQAARARNRPGAGGSAAGLVLEYRRSR